MDQQRAPRRVALGAAVLACGRPGETGGWGGRWVGGGEVGAGVPGRVGREFAKGLGEPHPRRVFEVLAGCGALARLLPEIRADEALYAALGRAAQEGAPLALRFALLAWPLDEAAVRALCARLRDADSKIGGLILLDVPGRVARLFLRLADENDGVHVQKPPTHQVIAQMVGSSRETVSRTIRTFATQQLIETSRQRVAIRDRRALERAFERLTVDERTILVLHHLDGRSVAATAEVLRILEAGDLLAASETKGDRLRAMLGERLGEHPNVGEIRGRGLMVGLELVAERETHAPFPRAAKVTEAVVRAAKSNGVLVYSGTGLADGTDGDSILLGPPFVVTDPELDRIVEVLGDAIDAVATAVGLGASASGLG